MKTYALSISREITENAKAALLAKEHIEGVFKREDLTKEEQLGYIWNLNCNCEEVLEILAEMLAEDKETADEQGA